MSFLRLANLAASHGWNVILFDPQATREAAIAFVAAVRSAGARRIYQFPGNTHLPEQTSDPFASEIWGPVSLENSVLPPLPLSGALSWHLDTMLPIGITPSALYVGVNIWKQPVEARSLAQLLLRTLLRRISEQAQEPPHTLLLLKHPELLFHMEQISPIFSLMQQAHGSVFAAVRTLEDFHWRSGALLKNAQTVIAHRGTPSWDLTSCLSSPWSLRHAFFKKQLPRLPDNECFVLHRGQTAHVRLSPFDTAHESGNADIMVAPMDSDGELRAASTWREEDEIYVDEEGGVEDELEELFGHLFGPLKTGQEQDNSAYAPDTSAVRFQSLSPTRGRFIPLGSADQVHLLRALSLFGVEDR